ncbi:dimethyl sulfoxide reductase anchor subunit [bacterium]|nr:dimethyl sulfoxide reductase anchor subunit [bacterium]
MVDLEIVPSFRQRSWGRLAVVNLTLGGAGAGLYLLGVLLTILGQKWQNEVQFVSFQLLAPATVCCGFLAVSLEAGRPMRADHLVRNLLGSWMSIESLAGGIFIIVALLDRFFPYLIFKTGAVTAALILMISQGFMVYRAAAVTAWNVWLVPVIFVTSGFMTACGLVLLNTQIQSGMAGLPAVISLICIFLNLVVWLLYLFWNHDTDFQEAVKAMRRPVSVLVTMGIGHLIPFVLLLSIFVSGDIENGSQLLTVVRVVSGLALIVGGISQKTGIILKAGYYRGIVFKTVGNEGKVVRFS